MIERNKPAVGGGLAGDVGDLLVAMDAHDPLGVGLAIPTQLDDDPLELLLGRPVGILSHVSENNALKCRNETGGRIKNESFESESPLEGKAWRAKCK